MSEYHSFPVGEPQVLYEICAGVERVAQPLPPLGAGSGDCWQCAAYAILRWAARERGIPCPVSLEDVYQKVWVPLGFEKGGSRMVTEGIVRFLHRFGDLLEWPDLRLEDVYDPPLNLDLTTIAAPTFGPMLYTPQSLLRRVRVYLEAGYVAYVAMQHKATRTFYQEGSQPHGADHIVVIDGYRESFQNEVSCYQEQAFWCGSTREEIHVVCSSTTSAGSYWIRAQEWVSQHGGYEMRFIRPARRTKAHHYPDPAICPEHGPGPGGEE